MVALSCRKIEIKMDYRLQVDAKATGKFEKRVNCVANCFKYITNWNYIYSLLLDCR